MSTKPNLQSLDSTDDHAEVYTSLLTQFTSYLQARGYANATKILYLDSVSHLLFWLVQRPSCEQEINPDRIREFIDAHLPVCHCPPPAPRSLNTVHAALNQLLLMQGYDRLHVSTKPVSAHIEVSIGWFDTYLCDVCGLSQETRWNRCRYVHAFLDDLFGDRPLVFERIDAKCLINHITSQARHYRPGTVAALASALRSYLRFLQFTGVISTTSNIAIPTPPNWRLAALPLSLNKDELARFWNAFDCSSTIGKRDYAIARCLADLALRCHEVAELRLNDIDWRGGVLKLRHTKSRCEDLLPLPALTAQALVDYLRKGRPVTSSRSVFVYHRAPLGKGIQKTTVRGVIRRAFERAGLAFNGTHILRHTAATCMLQGGASLKTIADVLRHRSIEATLIYTKVDLPQLSRVALPWPEKYS